MDCGGILRTYIDSHINIHNLWTENKHGVFQTLDLKARLQEGRDLSILGQHTILPETFDH
jgi:hypothetical protein